LGVTGAKLTLLTPADAKKFVGLHKYFVISRNFAFETIAVIVSLQSACYDRKSSNDCLSLRQKSRQRETRRSKDGVDRGESL